MNFKKIGPLFKREITDIIRDKKTLFMMVVLPILLYPLMVVGMTLLMSAITMNQQETVYKVCMDEVPVHEELEMLYEQYAPTQETESESGTEAENGKESDKTEKLTYSISFVSMDELVGEGAAVTQEEALQAKDLDAYVTYDAASEYPYTVHYLGASDDSQTAELAVENLLELYEKKLQSEKIAALSLDEDEILHPVKYQTENMSTNEQTMGNILGQMVPMLIIISIMMGAMYPAIDVTAGEKERGTLETLLTMPVSNFELIMSKFLAVSVIACVSAFFNIISMGAAFGFMFSYMADTVGGMEIHLSSFIPAILFTILVMLFFALFVTAVSMCVCIFAKSFKEANNYITPVMLVFMFGSLITMVPNIELDAMTAAIPIVNISLMIVKLFTFTYDYALFGIVLLSNVVYSLLAVLVLGKIYNSESVLFSEGMGSLKLFNKRSEMKENQIPGIGDIILLLCVQLLLMFYVGTGAQLKLGFGGVAVTQALILLVPLAYLWYLKGDYRKVLSLKRPKVSYLLGAFVTWIGTYILMLGVSFILMPLMQESTQAQAETMEIFVKQPLWALVLVIALMPAIGEECMFRGFVYGSLKDKTKNMIAMLITSALFGIYHMSLIKFFTTFILGFMFVMVVSETGSIFCSMLMHFCNNLVSVLLMKYADRVYEVLPILTQDTASTLEIAILLAVGGIAAAAGIGILRISKKHIEIKKEVC